MRKRVRAKLSMQKKLARAGSCMLMMLADAQASRKKFRNYHAFSRGSQREAGASCRQNAHTQGAYISIVYCQPRISFAYKLGVPPAHPLTVRPRVRDERQILYALSHADLSPIPLQARQRRWRISCLRKHASSNAASAQPPCATPAYFLREAVDAERLLSGAAQHISCFSASTLRRFPIHLPPDR